MIRANFTEEDQRLSQMPYPERVKYLEQKLKQLVYEKHGIIVTESVVGNKIVSDKDSAGHMVQWQVPEPSPPWNQNRTIKEFLKVTRIGNEWRWTLSFNERVSGDLNFDGVVNIQDITPLADKWFHFWNEDAQPPQWNEDIDPHLDRVTNGDGVLSIQDITPIAQNFFLQIEGYNVYYLPAGQSNWANATKVAEWGLDKRTTQDFRALWRGELTQSELPDNLHNNDQIRVKPVFGTGESDTWSDTVYLEIPPDQLPIAVLTQDITEGTIPPPVEVTFDGSGSYDPDAEDRITTYYFRFYRIVNGQEEYFAEYLEGESSPPDGEFDGITRFAFTEPGKYVCKLKVKGEGVGHSGWSAEVSSQLIIIKGPPAVNNWTATPNPAECGEQITFVVNAEDTDGNGIMRIRYDVDGDASGDTGWEYTENPGDGQVEHTFTPGDIPIPNHDVNFNSQVEVQDNEGFTAKRLLDFGPLLRVSHAVPHIVLTTNPAEPFGFAPLQVEFDASGSFDKDGPNGKPTKFEFIFGDGNTYVEDGQDGDDPDNVFGKTSHVYEDAGLFSARVVIYDEYDTEQECLQYQTHQDSSELQVRVYGIPTVVDADPLTPESDPEAIPTHNDYLNDLGMPSIAIDIRPSTQEPGLIYHSSRSNAFNPKSEPNEVPIYSWRDKETGLWSAPVLVWDHAQPPPDLENDAVIGEQCDLTYDYEMNLAHVAASFWTARTWSDSPPTTGIIYYYGTDIPEVGWLGQLLIGDATFAGDSPLRLVVDSAEPPIHYRRNPKPTESPLRVRLAETSPQLTDNIFRNGYETVEEAEDSVKHWPVARP